MSKYHVKKDGTPGICHAQEGNCPLGDSSQHFSSKEEAQDYADKINEEKAELSSMNTEEVKNRALEDNENGDKYRTELYNRLSNNTERKEFKLKEMKGNDFNTGNSGASISINDNSKKADFYIFTFDFENEVKLENVMQTLEKINSNNILVISNKEFELSNFNLIKDDYTIPKNIEYIPYDEIDKIKKSDNFYYPFLTNEEKIKILALLKKEEKIFSTKEIIVHF